MDLSALIGLILGLALLLLSAAGGGSAASFMHPASLGLVIGGTVAAALVHYPPARLLSALGALLRRRPSSSLADLGQSLSRLAEQARRHGVLALEVEAEQFDDPFLRKGIALVADGVEPAAVRSVLELDLAVAQERHRQAPACFESMAQYAPAFGLVGTLVGLVQMLRGMQDPAQIGPGLAIALLTTLYGVLLANLLFLPVAGKLRARANEALLEQEMALEALQAIAAGEPPSLVAERLGAFVQGGAGSLRAAGREEPAVRHPLEVLRSPLPQQEGALKETAASRMKGS